MTTPVRWWTRSSSTTEDRLLRSSPLHLLCGGAVACSDYAGEMPPWHRPLKRTRGGRKRLLGLRVYYDFSWFDHFPDRRVQFKNGLALARLASEECPPGKRPCLLLTDDLEASEVPITTDDEFVLVVRFPDYVRADNDAAASYYAHRLTSAVSGIAQIREIVDSPELAGALVRDHLEETHIRAWVGSDASRMAALLSILADAGHEVVLERVADIVRLMGETDASVWRNLIALLPQLHEGETRPALLAAIMSDQVGRVETSASLAERLVDRLGDVQTSAARYQELLDRAGTTETDLQQFIEVHPWLIGLEYARVRPRHDIPRGSLDFILERFDGSHDLLELKSPSDPIIKAPAVPDGEAPPASAFSLSSSLANALAQVHVYRDILTLDEATVERLYGLAHSRDPRIMIVIGQVRQLEPHRRRVLEQLNLSLHHVEIVPYDVIGERALAWSRSVEAYLSANE